MTGEQSRPVFIQRFPGARRLDGADYCSIMRIRDEFKKWASVTARQPHAVIHAAVNGGQRETCTQLCFQTLFINFGISARYKIEAGLIR